VATEARPTQASQDAALEPPHLVRMRSHATPQRGATVPKSPLEHCTARIVGTDDPPLILMRCFNPAGATCFDSVAARDGETLRLASGGAILGRFVIAAAAAGIPGTIPPWSGPGVGLWDWIAGELSPEAWTQIRRTPGIVLTLRQTEILLSKLFADSLAAKVDIVARPLPLDADTPFVRLDPALHGFWFWDSVTEQAIPKTRGTAQHYVTVRVVLREGVQTTAASVQPQRAGGLTTGAFQHAAAECRWLDIVARYDAKLAEGIKGKEARDAVNTEMKLGYNDDYLRRELKKRKAKVSSIPPEVS
jgi:hypothetical protein